MDTFLLANIGNRNIRYKNKVYQNLPEENRLASSFRDWTKGILNNLDNEYLNLELNILSSLPGLRKNEFKEIYLFYSDHPEDQKRDQDTIYEAAIIKEILVRSYGYAEEQVKLMKVGAVIVDNEGLLIYYRKVIRNLKRKLHEGKLLICDAGGTAQQKSSLKIICEFLLNSDKFEVIYINPNGSTRKVPQIEYRALLSYEQAITLIHQGEYTAAMSMLESNPFLREKSISKYLEKLFLYTNAKWQLDVIKSNKILGNMKVNDGRLKNSIKGELPIENESVISFFEEKDLRYMIDALEKAKFYLNILKYSESVLSFAHFYERFLESIIKKIFPRAEFGDCGYQSDDQKTAFESYFREEFNPEIKNCELKNQCEFRVEMKGLPTQVIVAKNVEEKDIKKIGFLLSKYMNYTSDWVKKNVFINSIRNKIAHEGLFISKNDIQGKYSFYPELLNQIQEIFQFKYLNTFEHLNHLLEKEIRK